ncbi:uncharacterized protein LOC134670470 [Cydia fagiglandana]|uniref:uncharacterized protein LOC134670470 n=1 Tax=Cydia fagiglandana TaxID=1458189 RepID=UPI002FEDFC91
MPPDPPVSWCRPQGIIDCFEVQIEKSSNPVDQSLSWSQYKGCNTAKYVISSTPNGFINFISKGYGGRISDVNLVEQCGLINHIPADCTILADRGFKHLETILNQKGVRLVRPPSVFRNQKQSKCEVLRTKVIASLRVHIERVIRRVRLFKLLKPHSTVNNKLLNMLDDILVVACGLTNLQTSIIRRD